MFFWNELKKKKAEDCTGTSWSDSNVPQPTDVTKNWPSNRQDCLFYQILTYLVTCGA